MHYNSIPELSLTYKVIQFQSSEVSQVKTETNIGCVIGKKNKSSHVGYNTPWVRHIQFIRLTTNNKNNNEQKRLIYINIFFAI